ncbi:hypothetical protein SteCoe_15668 [Stentor coeruleus]|uniref:J domain-containing protein n=1 Tax=Stentor coeruleus TaxID=5963 RepID=A0A1R2C337_9CILI|nr:hypothetical protein SteCoe_15668 [Stentor coeruleus]
MNPFSVLGIKTNASEKEIKKAYRKRALQLHPDKNSSTTEDFQELHSAYTSLLDPHTRKAFAEKVEREASISEKTRKLKENLIQREKQSRTVIPQKRHREQESYEPLQQKYTGVKVKWTKNIVYTEEILNEIFAIYGEIVKILINQKKAWIVFSNLMASDRVFVRPPEGFFVNKICEEKCKEIINTNVKQEKTASNIEEKLKILREKLSKKS